MLKRRLLYMTNMEYKDARNTIREHAKILYQKEKSYEEANFYLTGLMAGMNVMNAFKGWSKEEFDALLSYKSLLLRMWFMDD